MLLAFALATRVNRSNKFSYNIVVVVGVVEEEDRIALFEEGGRIMTKASVEEEEDANKASAVTVAATNRVMVFCLLAWFVVCC